MTGSRTNRVLIVDDNEDHAQTLAMLLDADGYATKCLSSATGLIDEALRFTPDLVLLDIRMPEVDGMQALQMLRARPELAKLPIIALTGLKTNPDRFALMAAGFTDQLLKPVAYPDLRNRLRSILQKSSERR